MRTGLSLEYGIIGNNMPHSTFPAEGEARHGRHIPHSHNLHHAYIIEGDKENILPELVAFLEKEHNVSTRGNPDFWCKDFESFGIDDGKILRVLQSRKAVDGGHKFFVITFTTITSEAQNALLKIFEEPTEGTHFFIIVSSLAGIFPTLLSRATIIPAHVDVQSYGVSYEKEILEFLKSSSSKRLLLIQNIIKEKDKNAAQKFLNQLEIVLWRDKDSKKRTENINHSLEEIIQARRHLATRVPSLKLVFEHLSLIVPTYK